MLSQYNKISLKISNMLLLPMKHTCRSINNWILHNSKDKIFQYIINNNTIPTQVSNTMMKRRVTHCLVGVSRDFRLIKPFHKTHNKHYIQINHSVIKYIKDRLPLLGFLVCIPSNTKTIWWCSRCNQMRW